MGILDKLLKPTPFYVLFKKYLQKQNELKQTKLEAALHPLRLKFYKQFINPSDTVFDVGANVGNRVVSFLECGANVIAVEPQPFCVDILRKKFGNKIIIKNLGLGETSGELEMHISNDTTVSSFSEDYINSTKERFKYSKWIDTIKVPITTLDDLIAQHGVPKFCKIDVEGFELQVLKGLHQAIPFLSIEYCVPEMQQQLKACVDHLHGLMPNGQFNYSVGESMQWAQTSWMDFNEFDKHINTAGFIGTSFGDIYFRST
jgi:FkbM family methyltransferase